MAVRGGERVRTSDIGSLDELAEAATACTMCRLCRDRRQVVVGGGNPDADVLVVIEAPGYHEDRAGRLLAGRAGDVFDDLLASVGYARDDVWLTSLVKCRPLNGRSAFSDEVEACEGWLFREISLVEPRIIVTFGAQAMRLVTGRHGSLEQARGTLQSIAVHRRTLGVLPCYHPAAALHVPALLEVLRADVRSVPVHLRQLADADAGAGAANGSRSAAGARPAGEDVSATALEQPVSPAGAACDDGDDQLSFSIA